ncbi:MAG: helix-turn-helix transcriptional regulator [Coriobacteriales bacterium]|nr:helix-turn-helix transcriptional regulator [Coriobacteriales bacterium]
MRTRSTQKQGELLGSSDKRWYDLAVLGLACYFSSGEIYRYPANLNVLQESFPRSLTALITAILFIAITVYVFKRNPRPKLYKRTGLLWLLGAAIVMRTCVVLMPHLMPAGMAGALYAALKTFAVILLVAYLEFFLELGRKTAISAFGIACIIIGALQLIASMMPNVVAIPLMMIVSAFASVGLIIAVSMRGDGDEVLNEADENAPIEDDEGTKSKLTLASTCAVLALAAFLFQCIHRSWLPLQDDGVVSLLIQNSAACGTMLAGCLIIWLRDIWCDDSAAEFCKSLLLPLCVAAMGFASFFGGSSVVLYVIPFNIAQKLALFLIWLAPMVNTRAFPPLVAFCWCQGWYMFGGSLQRVMRYLLDTSAEGAAVNPMVWLEIACMILLLIVALFSYIISMMQQLVQQRTAEDVAATTVVTDPFAGYEEACDRLAERYELTRREREVLSYLSRGRTAAHITQELVLSENTVRTHTRHIYRKLDVNSQQELINLVEEELLGDK